MLALIAYGVLVMLFTGYKSERVQLDGISAFNAVITLMTIVDGIESISVQILGSIGILEPVVLISIVILIWFVEFISLNIVFMFILSHIGYIGVRWYIKNDKENH